jgi:hypothetical protein
VLKIAPHGLATVAGATNGCHTAFSTSVPNISSGLSYDQWDRIRADQAYHMSQLRDIDELPSTSNVQWGPGQCAEYSSLPRLLNETSQKPYESWREERSRITYDTIASYTMNTNSHNGIRKPLCYNCKLLATELCNQSYGLSIINLADHQLEESTSMGGEIHFAKYESEQTASSH